MRDWENNIRKVVPYTPGEQPKNTCVIKLNTNENPYPPAPGVKEVLSNFNTDDLRLYPDPRVDKLVNAIADFYKIDSSKVFVGVGSDDVLAMIFMTFFNSKKPILFPDITYSFYDVWADMLRIPYEQLPLSDDFSIVPSDYYKANGGVVFPNPNAPTGKLMPLDEIEDIIEHNQDEIVVVDEAYVDFGGESALPLIDKYDNVIVVQTFSKSRALAGSRVGFAMANPVPEIMPDVAKAAGARVVGTGRSDFPNQINNVVAFPGIFKGALEGRATQITEEMKLAAAEALAGLVSDEELNDDFIMPEAFDPRVAAVVSEAVKSHI